MIGVALVLGFVGWRFRPRLWAFVCLGTAMVLIDPILAVVAGAGALMVTRWRSIRVQRSEARRRREDVLITLDLLSLGTTAGLPFPAAVSLASGEVGGPVAADLERAVARVTSGLSHSLDDGPLARAFDVADRSALSGASLGDSLVDLARDARDDQAAIERERIERLPVKLLFPLAFLILPGFVLVAVVPSIVSGIGQLTL